MSATAPIRNDEGADTAGPRNPEILTRSVAPDSRTTPNGRPRPDRIRRWARETTVRQLPISKLMSDVNMGRKAGAETQGDGLVRRSDPTT